MFKTLQAKILFSFIVVSLSGILFVSFAIQWGFEDSFKKYVEKNRDEKVDQVIKVLQEEYSTNQLFSGETSFNIMHEQAMTDNLFYKVINEKGEIVLDSTNLRNMMNEMGMNEQPSIENLKSKKQKLKVDNQTIATVIVLFPEGLIDNEFQFLRTIQQYILIAAMFTIFIAIIVSMLFSKKLTVGLKNLTKATTKLINHQLDVRIPLEHLSGEMRDLGISFNNLAESLTKQEKLRKHFTGDLAHELRTPLATLRSQLEAFQDGIFEPTPEKLQQFHDELMRLVRLVNELEKLIAVENPQLKLKKVKVDINEVLIIMGEMFEPAYAKKGVNLSIENSSNVKLLKVDRDKVIQILTNLLNNSLKYTTTNKNVILSAEKNNDMIGFIVEDEGIGISQEDLPYIFERFYRGDKSRNRNSGGIGVGLSIVSAIVKAHNGKIMINSEIGNGTKISVYFPME